MKKGKKRVIAAVVGSRTWVNEDVLYKVLDGWYLDIGISKVLTGGAAGADSLGLQWAHDRDVECEVLFPDWDKHGKQAGFIRNTTIVENATVVFAFWDGKSKGTLDTMKKAREAGKMLYVYTPEGEYDVSALDNTSPTS